MGVIFVMWVGFTPPKTTESQDLKLDLVSKFGMFFPVEKGVHFLNAKCWFPGLLICKKTVRVAKIPKE